MEHKGLLFQIVTIEHKRLPSKIVTMKEIELIIIFFLLGFLNSRTNSGKKNGNDMAVDVAQPERSNIECYASAFSNI